MIKNANFGPNLVVFGQKILFFYRKKQKFWYPNNEKKPWHLIRINFWEEMGQKCQYLAQNDQKCQFWAKFGRFRAEKPYSWYQCNRKTTYAPCSHCFWSGMGPNGPKMPIFGQKSQFWAKFKFLWE